jgi:acetylornithine deacetylase/succinyl-diaminopimelate desuccinylase family protein
VSEAGRRAADAVDPDRVTDLVSRLIAVPTVETVAPAVPLVARQMRRAGMRVEVYDTDNPRVPGTAQPVVLGTLEGRGDKPLLCYNGHTDVVPVEFPDRWTSHPFQPEIRNGRLYGRGAADMKGGLGAMIMAARAIRDAGITLDGSLVIAAVPGEESGGWGTESMAGRMRWDAAVIGEPAEMRVCPACSGITTFWVEISGRSAHASMPERGVNAIDKMARVLAAFERYRETLRERTHPLTGTPAFVSCIIRGGWRSVIVADRCSLHVTTHLAPGESAGLRLEEVAGILEELRAEDPELDYRLLDWKDEPLALPLPETGPNRARLDPTEISPDEPIVQALLRASERALGSRLPLGGTRYACDSPYFVNDHQVPALACGPGSIDQAHTYDEWVEVSQLAGAARLYAAAAVEFLGTR